MRRPISPTLRTLFAELQQQLETAPAAGSVYRRTTQAGEYIYAKVRVGSANLNHFLGKKSGSRKRNLRGLTTRVGKDARNMKKNLGV